MSHDSLSSWLSWQETLHPNTIDLGLERVQRVLRRLGWRRSGVPVVTVGGTKGKGSCVALLDSILTAAGHRVGTFTSPHLRRYNERIRIAGREVSDASLVAAFERIEAARGDTSLTFFEFNTLAALLIFETAAPDVLVLEIGMGGRLDAVNVVDPDVAILTNVALDHVEWLGPDVESIGREKAGIFRTDRPALLGAAQMPATVYEVAESVGCRVQQLGRDFGCEVTVDGWDFWHGDLHVRKLPVPALVGRVQLSNAATALAALDCLADRIPVTREAVETGLRLVTLPGRFQTIRRRVEWILDVAHNPVSAQTLADNLAAHPAAGRTLAVCGILGDKDIEGVVAALQTEVDGWIVAGLPGTRALPVGSLAERLRAARAEVLDTAPDVPAACAAAERMVKSGDRIVVFGSFLTVGPALDYLES